jgi:hypothetical protein
MPRLVRRWVKSSVRRSQYGRAGRRVLRLQQLKGRIAPAMFTATNTTDSDPGSLRQVIADANSLAGADTGPAATKSLCR